MEAESCPGRLSQARGDLVLETRTDPLIGTTTYGHDAYNRQTTVTDPNGTIVKTEYDELDRVRFVTQCGTVCGDADDLVIEYVYNVFGDLFQTILPKGNVIEYGYDTAGRQETVERKPDALPASHGERTLYGYDGFGHRVREELQRWDGSQWILDGVTEFEYSTRCYLDKTVEGAGTATESVTEYAYDCDGNLERIWDANHPSAGQTVPASTVYAYDDLNRLETVTQPLGGAGGGSAVTTYSYDVQDHLDGVTDAEGNVTSYTFSDRDLLTEEDSAVAGTTSHVYNEHGVLTETTDARGVVVAHVPDELDRETFVDYPGNTFDVTYTYDDPLVPFSLGRLTQILRDGYAVDYGYDPYGRMTQDGALTYGYDENGNRTEIVYPGGITAVYTHDYADRVGTLDAEIPGGPTQPVVTAASYYAAGPLSSLSLGNGLTETRVHDSRYHPDRITVAGASTLLDWDYTTDGVGNPTAIADVLSAANDRTYGYQDYQYFLTQGDGPWGARSWTYDRIGNRLTGGPSGDVTTYSYDRNSSGDNTPRLVRIVPAPVVGEGSAELSYDATGAQISWSWPRPEGAGVETVRLSYGPDGRQSRIEGPGGTAATDFLYDGRSFLREAHQALVGSTDYVSTAADYSSEGVLRARTREVRSTTGGDSDAGTPAVTSTRLEAIYLLYFGDRAVAEVIRRSNERTLVFLTTDHLGSPILATDTSGADLWRGGIAPFGELFTLGPGGDAPDADPTVPSVSPPPPGEAMRSVPVGAKAFNFSPADIFLRYPGQWDDPAWGGYVPGGMYYNVHRWYQPGAGRYTRQDPLQTAEPTEISPYLYVYSNPLNSFDSLGLAAFEPCSNIPNRPCPSDCDSGKLERALPEALRLRDLYCRFKNSPEVPPGIPTGQEAEENTAGSVSPIDGPAYKPQGDPCLDWCVCQHERQHEKDRKDPRVREMLIAGIEVQQIVNWLECRGYTAGRFCLQGLARGATP